MGEIWQHAGVGGDSAERARGQPAGGEFDNGVSALAPALQDAHAALQGGRLDHAEERVRNYLRDHPNDVNAMKMLAETWARLGRNDDSEWVLARCLEIEPGFVAARYRYATVLCAQDKVSQGLTQLDELLRADPQNLAYRCLRAMTLGQMGEYEQAFACHEGLLRDFPGHAVLWTNYATDLRAAGRQSDCVAAYRRAIEICPGDGDAYCKLAGVKTFRFATAELEAMYAQLGSPDISIRNRTNLHFALGKALEDAGRYEESFDHYHEANTVHRTTLRYEADETTAEFTRIRKVLNAEFFSERAGVGSPAADPIFIVGLPRSGSTLIEQVLASHPAIEGTRELLHISALARRLEGNYPDALQDIDADVFAAMGEDYLEGTRHLRKFGRPFFIDKMPANFLHVGLIHLILPNAKIVDVRRHPLDCCMSNFKELFGSEFAFTYAFSDLGHYYRQYVALMAHFDDVLPGKVHRVFYERMVEEPEREVRRLLEYLDLPFEERCLRFYETDRAVRTSSTEQVRRPLFREGIGSWRNFAPWLDPLKLALGDVLDAYPNVPDFKHG